MRRAPAARTTRRPRTTTSSSKASPAARAASGYFGFTYFEENSDKLKALKIDGGDGCVAPSVETAQRRQLHPAVPAAVHLPVEGCAGEAPGQGVPRLLPRERRRHRGGGAVHPAQRRAEGRHAVGLRRLRRVTMASTSPTKTVTAAGTSLRRSRPRYGERIIEVLLFAAALVSIATTVGIVIAVAVPTEEFFRSVSFTEFFTGTRWTPLFANPSYGVLPLVSATVVITLIAMVVAIPLGLGAAVYLSEYAAETHPQGAQADAGDPRRRAHRGLRVLRPQGHHAAAAGHLAAGRGTPGLQRPGRRLRDGHHDHPDRRVACPRTPCRPSRAACATAPTRSAAPRCWWRRGSSCRRLSRASSPPSCWVSRGRSARR